MQIPRVDNSEGLVLVYNTCRSSSFEPIRKIFRDIIERFPIVLVGAMRDNPAREVSEDEGRNLAGQWGALFFETSAKDGTNVGDVFAGLLKKMREVRGPTPIIKCNPAVTPPPDRANPVSVHPGFNHMRYQTQHHTALSRHPTQYRTPEEIDGRKGFQNEISVFESDEAKFPMFLHWLTSFWICGSGR